MTIKNGYGKPIKASTGNNLHGIDTGKIGKLESQIQALIEQLPQGSTTPRNFSPGELARVAKAQAAADKKALKIEAQIAKLNDAINTEAKKARTSRRKQHGPSGG